MNFTDRALGMSVNITRRDFINGVATAAGAALLPQSAAAQELAPEKAPDYYPPARTGMRGSHDGSFEVAHNLRDSRSVDLASVSHTNETYDLVVAFMLKMKRLLGKAAYAYPEKRRPLRSRPRPR